MKNLKIRRKMKSNKKVVKEGIYPVRNALTKSKEVSPECKQYLPEKY